MISDNIKDLIILYEAARWKKQAGLTHGGTKTFGKIISPRSALYKQPRLSKESVQKIRDTGIIKPEAEHMAGFEYGTKKIADKAEAKINVGDNSSHIQKNIYTSTDPIATRHEAYEARAYKTNPKLNMFLFNKQNQIGTHVGPSVLKGEKRDVDMHKVLYGNKINTSLDIGRKKTQEYKDRIQNLNDSDLVKTINNSYNKEKFKRNKELVQLQNNETKLKTKLNISNNLGNKILDSMIDSNDDKFINKKNKTLNKQEHINNIRKTKYMNSIHQISSHKLKDLVSDENHETNYHNLKFNLKGKKPLLQQPQ